MNKMHVVLAVSAIGVVAAAGIHVFADDPPPLGGMPQSEFSLSISKDIGPQIGVSGPHVDIVLTRGIVTSGSFEFSGWVRVSALGNLQTAVLQVANDTNSDGVLAGAEWVTVGSSALTTGAGWQAIDCVASGISVDHDGYRILITRSDRAPSWECSFRRHIQSVGL